MDFSGEMLAHLKRKLKGFFLEIIEADVRKPWPMEDSRVDLVITNLVLEHIEDLGPVFEQAHRVLRAQGKFFVSEFHPFRQYLGKKARFEHEAETLELDCYVHHVSEFMREAEEAGFQCLELKEWFDEETTEQKLPRLISFVFEKK